MRWLHSLPRTQLAVSIAIGSLAFAIVIALRAVGGLEFLELAAYDRFLSKLPRADTHRSRVLLVAVSEKDIRRFPWPLSDEMLASVLKTIAAHRPRAIGLDIYRDLHIPPGEAELDRVFVENPAIVSVMKFEDERSGGVPGPPALAGTDRVAFNDFPMDPDGNVRRGLLFVDDGENFAVSFALRLALEHLGPLGITPVPDAQRREHMRLGEVTIPPLQADDGGYVGIDAAGYQFLLDFAAKGAPFEQVSLAEVVDGTVDPQLFRDRIVLIGVVAESAKDIFYVPVTRGVEGDRQVFGVALHALVVDQLIRMALGQSSPIRVSTDAFDGAWILAWSLVGAIMSLWIRTLVLAVLRLLLVVVVLGVTTYLALKAGWWIPVVPPAIAWLMAAASMIAYLTVHERADRAELMQLFSRHVSRDVAEVLWQQRGQFLDGGRPRPQRLVATVLFTDLRGFTTLSEKLPPQVLMEWLNEYLETMANLVAEHGGIVDKFVGDAVMAVFGVPVPRQSEEAIAEDARNALRCALAMGRATGTLNAHWHARNLPTTGMRAGVFTGPLVAGSVGSANRLSYTVLGDTVNTAARLESYDKSVAGDRDFRILVGDPTLERVGTQFETERIGQIALRGKQKPVQVHLVLGPRDTEVYDATDEETRRQRLGSGRDVETVSAGARRGGTQ